MSKLKDVALGAGADAVRLSSAAVITVVGLAVCAASVLGTVVAEALTTENDEG